MKIKIWGVRGSIPISGPDTNRYGGNTSCIMVTEGEHTIILDGGSGMQRVELNPTTNHHRIDILLTHFHLDHIQGLGFFKPFFDPRMEVHIWGPDTTTSTLHSRLSRYLSPPLFPVLIRDLPCKLVLHEISKNDFSIGPFDISSRFVIHPGPTVGYRIRSSQSVFTYIPDHEPALGYHGMIENEKWISGIDLAQDCDLLYHDGQYTQTEYLTRRGWGHSGQEDAIRFASLVGAKRLLLGHHDPSRTDDQLDEIDYTLRKIIRPDFPFAMAKEGLEIELI